VGFFAWIPFTIFPALILFGAAVVLAVAIVGLSLGEECAVLFVS
jgi:hypothetical protein